MRMISFKWSYAILFMSAIALSNIQCVIENEYYCLFHRQNYFIFSTFNFFTTLDHSRFKRTQLK